MQTANTADPADAMRAPVSVVHVLAIWIAITAALVPMMAFMIRTERELSQYSTLTFESCARKALAAGDAARAERICTGAIRTAIARSDYWGSAYLLRAKAHAAGHEQEQALADLRRAARFWTKYYYYITEEQRIEIGEFGVELGRNLLAAGDAAKARQAFSAGGVGSGRPVDFLHEQWAALDDASKQALWPEGPCLTLEDFADPDPPMLQQWIEEQGRKLEKTGSDPKGSFEGVRCAMFEISAATKEGNERSYYGLPAYVPISQKPFALRARVKSSEPCEVGIALEYWSEAARKGASTVDTASQDLGNGWRLIDARRDFYAERSEQAKKAGYDPAAGAIIRIGLSLKPGPASRYWVDAIELYIPDAVK